MQMSQDIQPLKPARTVHAVVPSDILPGQCLDASSQFVRERSNPRRCLADDWRCVGRRTQALELQVLPQRILPISGAMVPSTRELASESAGGKQIES